MKKFYSVSIATVALLFCVSGTQAQVSVQTFSYTGIIETFTVPTCVYTMTVEARGAQGGFHGTSTIGSGLGASIYGVISVTPGMVLKILVGQQPSQLTPGNGGGGGSFVTDNTNNPLIVAGGGGGSSDGVDSPDKHGQTTTNGGTGAGGGGIGGTAGNGGNIGATFASGAGGGLLTNGQAGWTANTGGNAFVNGGLATIQTAIGGFGGGGSGSLYVVGGGGGGYSGGGAGSNSSGSGVGGGGGSFNAGTNQVNVAGVNTGHGSVSFSFTPGSSVVANVSSSVICSGSSATISVSGVNSHTWLPVGSFPGSSASSVVVTPGTNTSYSVSGTNSMNCITSAVIPIIVNVSPTVSAVANTYSICSGNTVILNGTGANSYVWTGGVTDGVPFSPASTSGYTVTGTNACGSASAALTVTVGPLFINASASPSLTCSGSNATLTASGAASYSWEPGTATGSNIVVNPLSSTIYTLTGKIGNCTGTSLLTLPIDPIPTISAVATDTQVCAFDSVTLTATGALSYTWMPGNISGSATVITPSVSILYTITGINQYSCTSQVTKIIVANPNPTVTAGTSATAVCPGGMVQLIASGTGGLYEWSHGPKAASTTATPQMNTVFTVSLTNQFSCTATSTIAVNIHQPTIAINGPTAVCEGKEITLTGGAASAYTWLPSGSFLPFYTVKPTPSTTYTLLADVNMGNTHCRAQNTIGITVHPNPVITAQADRTLVCRNESGTLTASGASTYTWTGTSPGNPLVVKYNVVPGTRTYSVSGTDVNGCSGSGVAQVKVEQCTGIAEHTGDSDFTVYPNPSDGNIRINAEQPETIYIFDALGKNVVSVKCGGQNGEVSVTGLKEGIYFVTASESSAVKKLVVQR